MYKRFVKKEVLLNKKNKEKITYFNEKRKDYYSIYRIKILLDTFIENNFKKIVSFIFSFASIVITLTYYFDEKMFLLGLIFILLGFLVESFLLMDFTKSRYTIMETLKDPKNMQSLMRGLNREDSVVVRSFFVKMFGDEKINSYYYRCTMGEEVVPYLELLDKRITQMKAELKRNGGNVKTAPKTRKEDVEDLEAEIEIEKKSLTLLMEEVEIKKLKLTEKETCLSKNKVLLYYEKNDLSENEKIQINIKND